MAEEMKKYIYVKIFALLLFSILSFGLTACTPIEIKDTPQQQISKILRYEQESSSIIEIYRLRMGAYTSILAVYDSSYEYSSVVAVKGGEPATGRDKRFTASPGYREIYESLNDDEAFYSLVDDLPTSSLKSDLLKAGRKLVVFSPVYTTSGYLFGYVSFRFTYIPKANKETIIEFSNLAATEISRLNGLLD